MTLSITKQTSLYVALESTAASRNFLERVFASSHIYSTCEYRKKNHIRTRSIYLFHLACPHFSS